MVIGVNYEEGQGVKTYDSIYVHWKEGEKIWDEAVFSGLGFVQDWIRAIEFSKDKMKEIGDPFLLGSSTVDDFFAEEPEIYSEITELFDEEKY